jgi:hypothetical protein
MQLRAECVGKVDVAESRRHLGLMRTMIRTYSTNGRLNVDVPRVMSLVECCDCNEKG